MALKKWQTRILYPILVLIYIIVGGGIFYAIENPLERESIRASNAKFREVMSKYNVYHHILEIITASIIIDSMIYSADLKNV